MKTLKKLDWRILLFVAAVLFAAYSQHTASVASHSAHVASAAAAKANREVALEEKLRVEASCAASTQSRGEIVAGFRSVTDFFRAKGSGDPSDLAVLDQIDERVSEKLGGASPLCEVPGATKGSG